MVKHFICKGECGGVSDKPGNCQAEECSLYQKPLVKCVCDNKEHRTK